MTKLEAIQMFGSQSAMARAIGTSRQAIQQWPDVLNQRRTNEVLGAALRLGKLPIPGTQPEKSVNGD